MRVSVAITCALACFVLPATAEDMSFFITSKGPGDGANLGGLKRADAHCQELAEAAGTGSKTWKAYLSTSETDGKPAVNARDRTGSGPWFNSNGVQVAANLEEPHYSNVTVGKEYSLSESGKVVNGRGESPNQHDILTGSKLDGTASNDGQDHTCGNWTRNGEGSAQVGHHDRTGGDQVPSS